jgi:hypothetical protein
MDLLITSIFTLIPLWIIFSTVNGLTAANDNCCRDKTCGKGVIDQAVWWINLIAAMIPTLYVAWYIAMTIVTRGKLLGI